MIKIIVITMLILMLVVGIMFGGFAFDDYREGECILTTVGRYLMAFIGFPLIGILMILGWLIMLPFEVIRNIKHNN